MVEFEWDENKNRKNFLKHGIRFDAARTIFRGQCTPKVRSDRWGEERWAIIGMYDEKLWSVAFEEKPDNVIRIISIRRARANERGKYRALFPG